MVSLNSSEPDESNREETFAPHLDALRILASGGIVLLHYANYAEDTRFGRFVYEHTVHFNLLVDLFFVISGFVIASQYLHRVSKRRAIARFVWRRLARIYPLHLLTLAFYVIIALLLASGHINVDNPARYPLSDVPAQLLLLHAIDAQRLSFNFPSWSLSAEMVCYLLFPLLAFIGLRRRAAIPALAVAIAAALTVYSAVMQVEPWPEWINQGGAVRALPAFLLGVTLYLFRDSLARWPLRKVLLPALAVYVFVGGALPVLVGLALVYLVAAAGVQCDVSGARTLLSRSGVGRWAHLTYSIYMLHMPVATVVITLGGRLLGAPTPAMRLILIAAALAVLVVVSMASYRLFENPVRRRLNGAFDRHRASARLPAIAATERGLS